MSLEKLWDEALRQVSEVKGAPVPLLIVFVAGAIVSWLGASRYYTNLYEERLAAKDERLALATERAEGAASVASGGTSAIIKWGFDIHRGCEATVERNNLREFAREYDVAVMCGFSAATVDRYEDTNVTLSRAVPLNPGEITFLTPVSKEMSAFGDSELRKALEALQASSPTLVLKGGVANFPVWFELVLIPKGATATNIHKLSDVTRLGGKMLRDETRMVVIDIPFERASKVT